MYLAVLIVIVSFVATGEAVQRTAGTTCTGNQVDSKTVTIDQCIPVAPQVAAVFKGTTCVLFDAIYSCSSDAASSVIAADGSGLVKATFTNVGAAAPISGYLKAKSVRLGFTDDFLTGPNELRSALRLYLVLDANPANANVFFVDDKSRLFTFIKEGTAAVKYYLVPSPYYHAANVPTPLGLDKIPANISFKADKFLTYTSEQKAIFLTENTVKTATDKPLVWNFKAFMETDMTTTSPVPISVMGLARDNSNATETIISFQL